MKKIFNAYGSLAVMIFCLLGCAVLLGSVMTGRPLTERCSEHLPVLRTAAGGEHFSAQPGPEAEKREGCLITTKYLEERLTEHLPAELQGDALQVKTDSGLLTLSLDLDRDGLCACMEKREKLPLSLRLLFRVLPRRLRLEAAFAVSAEDGRLHLCPVAARAGRFELPVTSLPESAFAVIDEGVNALLSRSGVHFDTSELTDEGLLLK